VTASLLAALLVGLAGSVHCLGMCGGISGALALGTGSRGRWLAPLLNSAGRVSSYALAGTLAGGASWTLVRLAGESHADHAAGAGPLMLLLHGLTALLFILIGLAMLGGRGFAPLAWLEAAGARLWRHWEPLARRALPARGAAGAYAAGLLWGWLPCGLVYSMLAVAASSASPWRGALLMAAFGLGTSFAVIAAGVAAGSGGGWMRQRHRLRRPAGALLIVFGLWTVWSALA